MFSKVQIILKMIMILSLLSLDVILFADDDVMKDVKDEFTDWHKSAESAIQFLYGTGPLRDRAFNSMFNCTGTMELKIGSASKKGDSTPKMNDSFIFGSYQNNALALNQSDERQSNIKSSSTRFGIGGRSGFAYTLGNSYLYPFNESSFSWARYEFSNKSELSQDDIRLLNRIEDGTRFGYSTQTGIEFGMSNGMSIRAGVEQYTVYPRVVFWEFAGSYALLCAGDGILEYVGGKITEFCPAIGPVLTSALRGAFSYTFFKAMKNNMNWPFDSEQPLYGLNLKIGTGFKF
jgi:hypothetical protein